MDKVLHILIMDGVGGAESMTKNICLNYETYKPIIVCGGNTLRKYYEKENIKAYTTDFTKFYECIKVCKKIIADEEIKILHAHDNKATLIAIILKLIYKKKIKVISHIHSCYPWLENRGVKKIIDRISRRYVDHNIACGNQVKEYYLKYSNEKIKTQVTSISNGVVIKENLNLKNKSSEFFKFGFIGRLEPVKGLLPLIKIVNKYKNEFRNCKFIIVGEGSVKGELQNYIEENYIENLFEFRGYMENVDSVYEEIDILFLPSEYEGLPMMILEGMANRKITIAMDVGSINDVIDESNGFLIPSKNYKMMVEKMVEVKNNKIILEEYNKNAFEKVMKDYNINNTVKNIELIYNQNS